LLEMGFCMLLGKVIAASILQGADE